MTIRRDWPIWKWASATAALFLAGGGLWALVAWIAPQAGLWERGLIYNGILAAALVVWWLGRDPETDGAADPKAREPHRAQVDSDEAARRFRIGSLLGLALAMAAGFLITGGAQDFTEALESLPPVSWGAILLILVHVGLMAGAMAVALTDTWPIYTLVALVLLLAPSMIADGALALGLSAVLVPIVALLLTFRSWRASVWFCLVAGMEWLLWTTVANGAAIYDPIDGVVGAAWALAAAFLAWTYGRSPTAPS